MCKELKPCPFCGGKAEIIIFSAEYGTVTVGCTNEECDITMGKAFFTDEEAIRHWNRRVNDETDWRRQIIRADKIVKAGVTNES